MQNYPLILASASPRRSALLRQIGITFKTMASQYEERHVKEASLSFAKSLTLENAKGKALNVVKSIDRGVVIGVDTLVLLDKKILGKPKNEKEALLMLGQLNGRMHRVISSVAVVKKDAKKLHFSTGCVVAKAYFRKVSDELIKKYVETKEPFDKAGGYGVQEKGAIFLEKIEGDYYCVVGLPIAKLFELTEKIGITIL